MHAQRRHELSEAQWERIAPLLPPQRPPTGRSNRDHRTVRNGILWILRTGAPWRDLPARYGKRQTVYSRFRRWRAAGVWERILITMQAEAAHDDALAGTLALLDGSHVRAHQHAAGAQKKGAPPTKA